MVIEPTKLPGVVVIRPKMIFDPRGFFARMFSADDLAAAGLNPSVAQCNIAFNHRRGTLRGMHYQSAPAAEVKLVRCTRGAVWDVAVDVRPDSPTYLEHVGVELSAENRAALYIPEGFAHGYQTLTDDAEVFYQVSRAYSPGHERGLRHDDPRLRIDWPLEVAMLSDKDRHWPLLDTGCPTATPPPTDALRQAVSS